MFSLLADLEKAAGRLGKNTRKSPVRVPKTICLFEGCDNLRMQPGPYDKRKHGYSYCDAHFGQKTRDKLRAKKIEIQE